jgi:hypothetical protein
MQTFNDLLGLNPIKPNIVYNPLLAFALLSAGTQLAGGIAAKKSADRAAKAAKEVGEKNATIIERDLTILENQRKIINANLLLDEKRARYRFSGTQGTVVAGFGSGGIDIAQGTPMRVLRQNAREFDYDVKVSEFNNAITNMQITDAQEGVRLSAEMSRMEGGSTAASLRAQGTQSLISGLGGAFNTGYNYNLFG